MRYVKNISYKMKYFLLIILSLGGVIILDTFEFEEGKYLYVMALGYFTNLSWGEKKPHEWINTTWRVVKVFLFSLIGAAIILNKLKVATIWKAAITILLGLIFRSIAVLIFPTRKFNLKERIFMAMGILIFNFFFLFSKITFLFLIL